MQNLARAWACAFIVLVPSLILAQTVEKDSGQISGVVSLGGKPAAGIVVAATPVGTNAPARGPVSSATTDEGGRYRLSGLPPGRYTVQTLAAALTALEGDPRAGKLITLNEGETAEGIDFKLGRGAVITGRITDVFGQPVAGERVTLMSIDQRGQKRPVYLNTFFMYDTDDRGVYRLFGLAPGRYLVSIGFDTSAGMVRIGTAAGYYARTFHPDVTDESRATIIELNEGEEEAGVDIVVSRSSKTYTASGRMIDGETGRPVANVGYGYGSLPAGASFPRSYGWSSNRTNADGEFRIEGVLPGRYAAFAVPEGESDLYSEPAPFEVANSDVTGIEIKLYRGASISGAVVVEGADDHDLPAKLSRLQIHAPSTTPGMSLPRFSPNRVAPDGTFRIPGLRPGTFSLRLSGPTQTPEFALLRVERDGVDVSRGIEVGPGEHVGGVRMIVTHGSGTLRGQVKFEGADRANPVRAFVTLRSAADAERPGPPGPVVVSSRTQVDARGRFLLERIAPGEYEVAINVIGVRLPPGAQANKTITVANGAVTEVSFVINLKADDKEDR